MNINNLKENQAIKNYKELCTLLEIKPAGGNTKIAQLKELSLYTDYHKEGNKIIIDKIKEVDKEQILLFEFSNSSKYIKSLSNIILTYLYKEPEKMKEIPLIKLLGILGVTNNNYISCNSYRKEMSQFYDIQLASIYYFYDTTRKEFKRIIERCLNNLQNRSILFWNKCIMIIDNNNNLHKADDEEKQEILNIQKQVLEELEVGSLREVLESKKLRNKFNDRIYSLLNFKYFFAYDIVIGDKAIKIEYENLLKNKEELNENILTRVIKIFSSDKYIKNNNDYKLLIDLLIDLEEEDNTIKETLSEKRLSNLENYSKNKEEKEIEYNSKINSIKQNFEEEIKSLADTYLDTFEED